MVRGVGGTVSEESAASLSAAVERTAARVASMAAATPASTADPKVVERARKLLLMKLQPRAVGLSEVGEDVRLIVQVVFDPVLRASGPQVRPLSAAAPSGPSSVVLAVDRRWPVGKVIDLAARHGRVANPNLTAKTDAERLVLALEPGGEVLDPSESWLVLAARWPDAVFSGTTVRLRKGP